MADDFVELNPGAGGDKLDSEAVIRDGETLERERIQAAGVFDPGNSAQAVTLAAYAGVPYAPTPGAAVPAAPADTYLGEPFLVEHYAGFGVDAIAALPGVGYAIWEKETVPGGTVVMLLDDVTDAAGGVIVNGDPDDVLDSLDDVTVDWPAATVEPVNPPIIVGTAPRFTDTPVNTFRPGGADVRDAPFALPAGSSVATVIPPGAAAQYRLVPEDVATVAAPPPDLTNGPAANVGWRADSYEHPLVATRNSVLQGEFSGVLMLSYTDAAPTVLTAINCLVYAINPTGQSRFVVQMAVAGVVIPGGGAPIAVPLAETGVPQLTLFAGEVLHYEIYATSQVARVGTIRLHTQTSGGSQHTTFTPPAQLQIAGVEGRIFRTSVNTFRPGGGDVRDARVPPPGVGTSLATIIPPHVAAAVYRLLPEGTATVVAGFPAVDDPAADEGWRADGFEDPALATQAGTLTGSFQAAFALSIGNDPGLPLVHQLVIQVICFAIDPGGVSRELTRIAAAFAVPRDGTEVLFQASSPPGAFDVFAGDVLHYEVYVSTGTFPGAEELRLRTEGNGPNASPSQVVAPSLILGTTTQAIDAAIEPSPAPPVGAVGISTELVVDFDVAGPTPVVWRCDVFDAGATRIGTGVSAPVSAPGQATIPIAPILPATQNDLTFNATDIRLSRDVADNPAAVTEGWDEAQIDRAYMEQVHGGSDAFIVTRFETTGFVGAGGFFDPPMGAQRGRIAFQNRAGAPNTFTSSMTWKNVPEGSFQFPAAAPINASFPATLTKAILTGAGPELDPLTGLPLYVDTPTNRLGYITTVSEDFIRDVSLGRVAGHTIDRALGRNDAVSGTFEDIWNPSVAHTYPAAAAVHTVVSSSALDTAAGTGIRQIVVQGLDAALNVVEETVTLLGLVPVVTTTAFLRIQQVLAATVGTGGVAAGNITITHPVAGLQAQIDAGANRSYESFITVPAGLVAVMVRQAISSGQTDEMEVVFQARAPGANMPFIDRHNMIANQAFITQPIMANRLFVAGTDLRWQARRYGGGTGKVHVEYDLLYIDASLVG